MPAARSTLGDRSPPRRRGWGVPASSEFARGCWGIDVPSSTAAIEFRLRVSKGEDIAIGRGKVDLLEAIAATGSITAAAKQLGMSYRRAWMLVDTMNRCFTDPVLEAEPAPRRRGRTPP